ncbi:MAG: hypothetical protein P4L84_12410 [Isosphaeraceae bacterium]|nr:hypothetical protein [Isosphaeraceae bacterium]
MARVEGVLDHDQSIVGLMALDVAAGRRWPIFFDGQRYMGAIEPYVAALLVKLFGHSPSVVAMAPLLFFGLFVAAQYAVWRTWSSRATGHGAALVAVLGAPMLVLWSMVPRGGYVELLAWGVPVLGVYRSVTRSNRVGLSAGQQAGWGLLLALGYFVNPLSIIVYLTLAVDWTVGRHGADLRSQRKLQGTLIDGRLAPLIWCLVGLGTVLALAFFCHVDFRGNRLAPYVFCMGWLPARWGLPLGTAGIAMVLGGALLWSGAGLRACRLLLSHPGLALGALGDLFPFAAYNVLVLAGLLPLARSMPIWIRAPWDIGVNVRNGFSALGVLLGCDPNGPASVLVGQGVELPPVVWPGLVHLLSWLSPAVVGAVFALLGSVAWADREAWRRFWSLRGDLPTPGTVLALLGLAVTALLYLLQATSPNSSSIRYLVPAWIFLPGLVASALRLLPRGAYRMATVFLLAAWPLAQVNLWAELDRTAPMRPLVEALERRGVQGIIAETPVALIVANLSHGRVGALEYAPNWPRLGNRYLGRFAPAATVTCVVDTRLTWSPGEHPTTALRPNLGPRLHELAERYPGRVRVVSRVAQFEVWDVALPLREILLEEDGIPFSAGPDSANLSADLRTRHSSRGRVSHR